MIGVIERVTAFFMSIFLFIASLFGIPYEKKVQNVILLIGDGMGFNHLNATEKVHGVELSIFNRFQYYGEQMTRSASSPITDSAAGGTALATGSRTMNGYVGVYPTDPLGVIAVPASVTDVAMKYGKSTGIVTSDSIMGATPSSFSAHVRDRDLSEDIFAQQVVSEIDLIWGAVDGIVTEEEVNENGKVYVNTLDEVQSLELGQQSIGQFDCDTLWQGKDNGDQPTLSELATEAIDILNQDEDGFFMMLEAAHIDKRSHDQDGEGAMTAVLEFDKVVDVVLDYAEKDGNTLVIITADHETGGVSIPSQSTDFKRADSGINYRYATRGHSGTMVPVYLYGAGAERINGILDNTELAKQLMQLMALE